MSAMLPIGAIVDGEALLDMLWASVLAGIGVTACYAMAILGATRAIDSSRDGRVAEAAIFGVVAGVAILVVAGAVIFGIVAMTDK